MNCNPSTLANLARCFSHCSSQMGIQPIKTYILCALLNKGGIGGGGGGGAPTPTAFSVVLNPTGGTSTASWATPPAGVTSTEVWVSQDGVNYTLNNTVAAPGTSATANTAFTQQYFWIKARHSKSGSYGSFTTPFIVSGNVSQWSTRVITNGGAAVSANTMSSMNTFDVALNSAGLSSKMIAVNCFVPDNLIASITPLLKGSGNDPWTNNGFASGDLTVNGLVGNGAKYLNTGINPSVVFPSGSDPSGAGASIYVSSNSSNGSEVELGTYVNPAIFMLAASLSGLTYFYCFGLSTPNSDYLSVSNSMWTGFLTGNRTSPTTFYLHKASSSVPFTQIASGTGNFNGTALNQFCYVFAYYNGDTTGAYDFSTKRLSFAAIHNGLAASDAQTLYNAVQALRTALGGGYV